MARLALLASVSCLLAPVSCSSYGLHRDMSGLRMEIETLQRDVPPESPLWITTGDNAFDKHLEDFSPAVPDFIYNHILSKLQPMAAAEIDALAKTAFPVEAALKEAAPLRGKYWKLRGTIGSIRAQPSDPRAGTREIHAATLWIGETPVLVHVLQKPDVMTLGSDSVECSGLFLKILTQHGKDGSVVNAPFFLAKSLRKYY